MKMKRKKKKRQFALARKYALALLAVILITGFAVCLNGIPVEAGNMPAEKLQACESSQGIVYKSIRLEPGDTLWGIALEYKDSRHGTTRDYINEIMKLNGLTSDRIHAGRYLAVPCYSSQ